VSTLTAYIAVNAYIIRWRHPLNARRSRPPRPLAASLGPHPYVTLRPRDTAISPVLISSIRPNGRTMFSKAAILSSVPVISTVTLRF
jgi:hypothetical protein